MRVTRAAGPTRIKARPPGQWGIRRAQKQGAVAFKKCFKQATKTQDEADPQPEEEERAYVQRLAWYGKAAKSLAIRRGSS
jgi:hypothetical protein